MSVTGQLASQVTDRLLSFIFPPFCLACRQVEGHVALDLGLCSQCHRDLRPLGEKVCWSCGRPIGALHLPQGYACGACRTSPPPFQRLLSGWSYEPPFDRVIHGLKFGRLVYLGNHLARHLVERFGAELTGCDLVVAVPLHWSREIARGYNQAEEIARPLARQLGLPRIRGLRRARRTPAQTRLDRAQRVANLRGAFRARGPARVCGKAVVLVDDVVTTGATIAAAAACLKGAGARRVVALTAGRTPLAERTLVGAGRNRPSIPA